MTDTSRRGFLTLSGLTLGAAGLGLAGCSSGSGAGATASNSLTALWVAFDPLVAACNKLTDTWQTSSKVTVTRRTVPFSDWDRTIRALPQQPNGPDLLHVDGPNLQGYAANGLMYPLDRFYQPGDLDDFLPGTTPGAMFKGKFYGPATNESSQAFFYNKKILAAHGITPPTTLEDAWTWTKFRDVCVKLQADERKKRGSGQFWAMFLGQGGIIGGGLYAAGNIVRSNGAAGSNCYKMLGENGLKATGYVDDPSAMEALDFIRRLYVEDKLVPQSEAPDFFYNKQVAFWQSTPVYAKTIGEKAPDLEWGVMPHPYFTTPIVQTDSFHIGVNAKSKNADKAGELVAFLSSASSSLAMAQDQGVLASRVSALAKQSEFAKEPLTVFRDTIVKWAVPRPVTAGFSEFDALYSKMVTDLCTGAPLESTVQAATAQMDQKLGRYASVVK